jgi:hypothetical protein
MCTKVIDETTLRIYFLKASNTEPVTPDFSSSITTPLKSIVPERAMEFKDKDDANTHKVFFVVYYLSP